VLSFNVNFQNTDACGSNSKTAFVALKMQLILGNYSLQGKQHSLCSSRFGSSFMPRVYEKIQNPKSKIQNPKSKIQNPTV
jgi:hypothetical protein